MLKPELAVDPAATDHFLKEARRLMEMAHPGIVRVFELSGGSPGRFLVAPKSRRGEPISCPVIRPARPYFVMPLFRSGALAELIRRRGPLKRSVTLRWASEIAAALSFAHSKGVVHGDLKPMNILISTDGKAVLADFGLAWCPSDDSVAVMREQRAGTANYMSPGLAAGQIEFEAADVYALGAVMYEMLTGRPPFAGLDRARCLAQVIAGPPRPILNLNPAACPDLARIAEGAMMRDVRQRYASAAEVLAELERLKRDELPIGPLPASTPEGKRLRKRRS
jgi:serine/threonine-protein kinase